MDRRTLDYYDSRAKDLSCEYRSASVEHLHRTLKELLKPETVSLDLGCGSGREMSMLASHGANIWGADASLEMLLALQTAFPELRRRVVQCRLPDNLPFHDSSFELVLCISVLMHLDTSELPRAFAELRRVSKTGAKLVFSVPLERTDIMNDRDPHGRRFTMLKESEWVTIADQAGFSLVTRLAEPDGLGRVGTSWLTLICACSK